MKNDRSHSNLRRLSPSSALACALLFAGAAGCSDTLPPPAAPGTPDSVPHVRILLSQSSSQSSQASTTSELTLPEGTYRSITEGEAIRYEPHCRKMILVSPQLSPQRPIQIVEIDGGASVTLSTSAPKESILGAGFVAISPAGTRAAYAVRTHNNSRPDTIRVRIVDPKTSAAVDSPPLISGPFDRVGLSTPAFSPDGKTVAIFGSLVGAIGPPEIMWLIDVDAPQNLRFGQVSDSDGDIWFADLVDKDQDSNPPECAWSPDGERIAFVGRSQGGQSQVVVVNARSYSPDQHTFSVTATTNEVFGAERLHFSWSPDGSKIAITAMAEYGGNSDLWLFDPISGRMTQLTETPNEEELFPRWSADGSRIFYIVGREPLREHPGVLRAIDLGSTPYRIQTIADSVVSAFPE